MEIEKIIIIGSKNVDSLSIAKELVKLNDNLSICPRFISDSQYSSKVNENYIYFMPTDIVNLSYKNNSILFVKTDDYISSGVTLDDYMNSNIVVCGIDEFNTISEKYMDDEHILFIWCDTAYHSKQDIQNEIDESFYLTSRISERQYLYFLDEEPDFVAKVINQYVTSKDPNILNEFN